MFYWYVNNLLIILLVPFFPFHNFTSSSSHRGRRSPTYSVFPILAYRIEYQAPRPPVASFHHVAASSFPFIITSTSAVSCLSSHADDDELLLTKPSLFSLFLISHLFPLASCLVGVSSSLADTVLSMLPYMLSPSLSSFAHCSVKSRGTAGSPYRMTDCSLMRLSVI